MQVSPRNGIDPRADTLAGSQSESGRQKTSRSPLVRMISEVAIKSGDKLVALKALKILLTVTAPAAGIMKEVPIAKDKQADTGDLLVVLGREITYILSVTNVESLQALGLRGQSLKATSSFQPQNSPSNLT